jgi:hypothetical protein
MNVFRGSSSFRGSLAARILFVAIAMLGAATKPATAQTVEGKFTFAQETRWGNTILPAGNYTYSIEQFSATPVIVFHGEGKGAKSGFIPSTNWNAAKELRASKIVLVPDHGEMTVQSFSVAALGRVFNYPVGAKNLHAAVKKQPVQTAMAQPASH